MLNIGRPVTLQDRMKDVEAQIQAAQAKIAKAQSGELSASKPFLDTDRIVAGQQRLIATLNDEAAALSENIKLQNAAALKQGERAASVKNAIKADEDAARAPSSTPRHSRRRACSWPWRTRSSRGRNWHS